MTFFSKRGASRGKPLSGVDCHVHDFFVFRDILFVRGIVGRRGGRDPEIVLVLGDGSRVVADFARDAFFPSDERQLAYHFSHRVLRDLPAEQVEKMRLVFNYADGHCEWRNSAGAFTADDPFLNSEAEFWAAVKAAPGGRVLEIGSRARSGITRRDLFPASAAYVGFDIVEGPNVDVVGDAHKLSAYFPRDHFDFAFSVSVWEHLAMPWLVSLELNRVMKTGGLAMINSHQSWPSHEEPWDYFRFSDSSWRSLFNAATGFEVVKTGTGIPCVMRSSQYLPAMHSDHTEWHYGYLATRCVVRKISDTTLAWPVDPATASRGLYPH
ncbi:MAG TPA: methyltransferase domain-containing protein [Opitutaceae bacterium]|jgi:hypothetical protein